MALGALGAIKFIEDPTLLDDGDPVVIVRTWKERLFSLPWKPFLKTKTIVPKVPSKYVYSLPNGQMVVHPVTMKKLRNIMANYPNR